MSPLSFYPGDVKRLELLSSSEVKARRTCKLLEGPGLTAVVGDRMRISALSVLLFTLLLGPAWARTWTVTPRDAGRLQETLERLEPGDKVVFERGEYRLLNSLELFEKQDITLEGRGKVEFILPDLWQPVISVAQCRRVTIRHIRARHAESLQGYECEGAVISIQKSEKIGIFDCHLNGCGAAGVYAIESKTVVVKDNTIFNNTYAGVWLAQSEAYVLNNRIVDNAASVITWGDCRLTMIGNEIKNNRGNDYTGADDIERLLK